MSIFSVDLPQFQGFIRISSLGVDQEEDGRAHADGPHHDVGAVQRLGVRVRVKKRVSTFPKKNWVPERCKLKNSCT